MVTPVTCGYNLFSAGLSTSVLVLSRLTILFGQLFIILLVTSLEVEGNSKFKMPKILTYRLLFYSLIVTVPLWLILLLFALLWLVLLAVLFAFTLLPLLSSLSFSLSLIHI